MLIFAYACPVKYGNPMGHRIMKKVSTPTQTHTTLYSRDAQGNVLATYDFIPKTGIDITYIDKPNEMMIYGSSRLGVKRPLQQRANSITNHATVGLSVSSGFFPKPFAEVQAEVCGNSGPETYVEPALDHTDINYFRKHINESSTYLVSTVFGNPPMSYLYPEFTCSKNLTHTRLFTGMSEYELTNHLGNAESPESLRFGILSTVKDEPILTPEASLSPSNEVAFTKKPLILTAQDYYPFGMLMPNRSFSLAGSNYRFGFNTQEKDDEVYGKGNLMSAKFWEYDTRIGRRWNTDPIVKIWESPYATNYNNPIFITDPNGDDGDAQKDQEGNNNGWVGDVVDGEGNMSNGCYTLSEMNEKGLRPLGKEVTITPEGNMGGASGSKPLSNSYFDGYFNSKPSGNYGPYNPDAISFSVEVGVSTMFAETGFGLTGAITNNDAALIPSTNISTGSGKPGFYFNAQFNIHDKYGDQKDVLKGLGGMDLTGKIGAGAIIGYSKSAQFNSKTNVPEFDPIKGVETYSLGLGFELGGSTGISMSPNEPYTLKDAVNAIKKNWNK